jgi:hypothetical protein
MAGQDAGKFHLERLILPLVSENFSRGLKYASFEAVP